MEPAMSDTTNSAPVTLRPVNLCWLKGASDDPADLCAHGHVEFRVGGDVLLDPATSSEATVSAAALYLLRTLSKSHSKANPVGDHLFPCCGSAMFDEPGEPNVLIVGCPNGLDFEILHVEGDASVRIQAEDGRTWQVTRSEWQAAVFQFTDLVAELYSKSTPKRPSWDDAAGFKKFAAEWESRRGKSLPGQAVPAPKHTPGKAEARHLTVEHSSGAPSSPALARAVEALRLAGDKWTLLVTTAAQGPAKEAAPNEVLVSGRRAACLHKGKVEWGGWDPVRKYIHLDSGRILDLQGQAVRWWSVTNESSHPAWRDYEKRLRLLGWALFGFLPGALATGLLLGLVAGSAGFGVAGALWLAFFAVAAWRYQAFKCPRCGKACHHRFPFKDPHTSRCMHCGLPRWAEP
jgi:hypothetical protein